MTIHQLYRSMLRIRRVEEAIAERYMAQEIRCPVHLSIGQEGIAVGVCTALRRSDGVFSNHRAHAHFLAKGGNLQAMLAELYGLQEGCCRGVGGSMHMVDLEAGFLGAVPIVGATVPLAVGAAWAARLRGEDKVIAIFFGDGAFEEGVVHESINFALLHSLPVLFICENNQYACYTRLADRQPARPIHDVAAAYGCESLAVDGNDVQAVFAAATNAVSHLRAGYRPVFLEFSTYRWREHCGPEFDNHLGYRPVTELVGMMEHCPIRRLQEVMLGVPEGVRWVEAAEQAIAAEIESAFAAALAGPLPDRADLPGYLYA